MPLGETKKEVKTFRVYRNCPNVVKACSGDMIATEICKLTNPKQYEHICNMCGNRQFYTELYPKISYEEI